MRRKYSRTRWPPISSARRGGSCWCLHPSGDAFPLPPTTIDRVEEVARDSQEATTAYRVAAMASGDRRRGWTLEAASNIFCEGSRANPRAKSRP